VPDKYIVIFDTVTLVQAVINPKGPAGKCLFLKIVSPNDFLHVMEQEKP